MPAARKQLAIAVLSCVWALALGSPAFGWGTLTGQINLTTSERSDLLWLIDNYAVDPDTMRAEFSDRRGPHPIHQFLVFQAYVLLQQDPAYADGDSGFPTGEEINAWDGIDHSEHGMRQRDGKGLTELTELAPVAPGVGGPSADAELTASGGYNQEYNGRAHYWNPWLQDGWAPKYAASNYSRLVKAIVEDAPVNDKAHYASYMAHYLADVASAKHADAFTLDDATVARLSELAEQWFAAISDDTRAWLRHPAMSEAVALLRSRVSAINPGMAARYWSRVDRHIGANPQLQVGNHWLVDIPPSSLESAVGAYLHDLHERPSGKRVDQFFTYFDPFYFNGPIYDAPGSYPSFKLCTPMSEHLTWETSPSHFDKVLAWMQPKPVAMTWSEGVTGNYHKVIREPAFYSPDWDVAKPAQEALMAQLVKDCSAAAHGAITSTGDFDDGPHEYMRTAIRHLFTAFRASITALRVEAFGSKDEASGDVKLVVSVKNLADKPAELKHLRVMVRGADGRLMTKPDWTFPVAGAATRAKPFRGEVELSEVPEEVQVSQLVVDVRGEVADTPDSGWRRAKVKGRLEFVKNPGATTDLSTDKGPIDVVVVLDTTSSMRPSIDSLRNNAIASIKRLKAHSSDIRMAVTTFRDLGVKKDRPHFKVSGFSRDLDSQFAFLRGLVAGGGGDVPEDQLHGVSLAIKLWEDEGPTPERVPGKFVVVITDAPAKSPDSRGNTFASIAKRAFDVDPAHVYPVVVGRNARAKADAAVLADKTGGKVLTARTGAEVADALLSAVETASKTYPAPVSAPSGPNWPLIMLVLGGVAAFLGFSFILVGLGRRRRRRGHV